MSLLRAMQRTGIRTLVHLSSLAVYGKSSLNLLEEMPFDYAYPNPYIKSQQMILLECCNLYRIGQLYQLWQF